MLCPGNYRTDSSRQIKQFFSNASFYFLITHNPHPVRSPSRKATRWDRKRLLNRFESGTKRRAGRQISAERLRCSSNMSFVRNQVLFCVTSLVNAWRSRPCGLRQRRIPDEVHGTRAVGSLVVGDLESATAELGLVRTRYLVGFLVRLAMLMPTISMRLAWRIGAQRWLVPGPTGRWR